MKYAHKHKIREDFPPHAKVVEKICKYCGTPFWTNRHWAEFGTPTCRVYYWREQKGKGNPSKVKARTEVRSVSHSSKQGTPNPEVNELFEVKPYARKKIYALLAEVHGSWEKQVIGGEYHEWIRKAEIREFSLAEIYRLIKTNPGNNT